jgi:hypothetical protein
MLDKDRLNNRPLNINNHINNIILDMVRAGATYLQISKKLRCSKSALSQRLKRMEKRGLITRQRRGRLLILTIPHAVKNNPTKEVTYRIHDFWLTLKLRNRLANDTTQLIFSKGIKLASSRALANHTDSYFIMDGYTACLSPSSIQIRLPDLDNLPLSADLQAAALGLMEKLEPVVIKIEARLGVQTVRIDKDTLIAKISQLHVALKNHAFAETINDRGEKLYVYVDDELRVIVDKSHGIDEWEAVNAKHALDDGQQLGKLSKAVITGAFDYEKEQQLLLKVIEIQSTSQEQLNQLIEQINVHSPFWNAMNVVGAHLSSKNPADRKRAAEEIKKAAESIYQRKLFIS